MEPLISVIVPIYNAEKYLTECIESIRNQTYKNLQIILVNDGSTDMSLEICESFARIDSRILIINQKNLGVSAARNRGIEAANGEYIGFVDSDDYLDNQMYEKLLKTILVNNADICALMNYTIKPVSAEVFNKTKLNKCEALKELFLLRFPTSLWAYLYKKEIIKQFRLNENIHFFEDFEYNYRIINKVNSIALCFDALYYYRSHEKSTNNQNINNKRMTCLEIYNLHEKAILNSEFKLYTYSIFFRTHFLISVIISIAKSDKVDPEYKKITRTKAKEIFLNVLFSRYIPLKYKFAIMIYIINPSLFKFIMNLKNKKGNKCQTAKE